MCRLLGWASSEPTTLAQLLGEKDLQGFLGLWRKHGDGWGVARSAGSTVEVVKESGSAACSAGFAALAHEQASDLALVHLRWATLGLPVAHHNAHPFTNGRLAFGHNGSVDPPAALDALLDDHARELRRGDTDSERLFLALLSRLGDGHDDAGRALVEAVRTVWALRPAVHCGSLNSMLLTPSRLFALCSYDPLAQAREDEPDYYRLRFRSTPTSVVVASTGWGDGWTDLRNGQLLSVDRVGLEVRIIDLEGVPTGD